MAASASRGARMDDRRIAELIAAEGLPADYAAGVEAVLQPLAAAIAAQHRGAPQVIGIAGPQGSGKTTAVRFLAALLQARGLTVAILSLDDLYLGQSLRAEVAARVHPLFGTRGVPGTHDVALGCAVLDAVKNGRGAVLPRFDKARDAPGPSARTGPVDLLLFEGWCVGAVPEPAARLAAPVNALEAEEDAEGRWRGAVNDALAGPYAELFARIDRLVMLRPPGFEAVPGWRQLQEAKLRAKGRGAMSEAEVARFVRFFERLTRWMLAEMPERADWVVEVGSDHRLAGLKARGG